MKKFGNMILALLMAFAVGLVSCSVDSGSGHNGPYYLAGNIAAALGKKINKLKSGKE